MILLQEYSKKKEKADSFSSGDSYTINVKEI